MKAEDFVEKRKKLIRQIAIKIIFIARENIFDLEVDKIKGFYRSINTRFTEDFKCYVYVLEKEDKNNYSDIDIYTESILLDLLNVEDLTFKLNKQKTEIINKIIIYFCKDIEKIKESLTHREKEIESLEESVKLLNSIIDGK